VLVGVTCPEQLEENLSALELELSAEQLGRLDQLSELAKPYPNWFIDRNRDPIAAAALAK
jgi:aryl-alcohol dehydrogenase-like predicted oxidoreductase